MNIEELEEIKRQNNEQIEINYRKNRILKANLFEEKIINTMGFSMLSWPPIFLGSATLITKLGVPAFTNFLPALGYNAMVMGSSLGVGTLVNYLTNIKVTKGLHKSFSTAKTETKILEEAVHYKIEQEKLKNRNRVIDETIKTLGINMIIGKYDLNDKVKTKEQSQTKVNELPDFIEKQYNKLDILTTKKVLHDNFWKIRSKFKKVTNIIIKSILIGMIPMLYTFFALYLIWGINLASVLSPFVIGSSATCGFMIKRNKEHKKAFKSLNSQLGENALDESYKKDDDAYEEKKEIESLIEAQISEISLAEVLLKENQAYLNRQIAEQTEKVLENHELDNNLGEKTKIEESYSVEEDDQEQHFEEEKGPTLVKRR